MNTYRIRPGFAHWHRDANGLREFQGGETLELTEVEAKGLLDKLEFVEEVPVKDQLKGVLNQATIKSLKAGGIETIERIKTATDEQLLAITGIDDKALAYIRENVK